MPDVFVSVISGRSVANVQEMVGIKGITYAGNHGLEIVHPDGSKFVHPMPREMEERVGQLTEQLEQECCQVSGDWRVSLSVTAVFSPVLSSSQDGAWVENKGALLTFHYRKVPPHRREPLVARARQLIAAAGFNIGAAHCALEVKRPPSPQKNSISMKYPVSRASLL